MRWKALALLPLLAGCGSASPPDQGGGTGSTTPRYERPQEDRSLLGETVVPVRIGEMGGNFAACTGRGRLRDRAVGGPVPVRAGPFEPAQRTDELAQTAEFFICSRSHDQAWFGIVYDEGGRASERCGVSQPVAARRDYEGPCASGWVPSSLVRLVSGAALPTAEAPPQP
jgi:hypothetical protein